MPWGIPYNESERKMRHEARYGTRDVPPRRGLRIGILGSISEDQESVPLFIYPLKRIRWFMNRIFKR